MARVGINGTATLVLDRQVHLVRPFDDVLFSGLNTITFREHRETVVFFKHAYVYPIVVASMTNKVARLGSLLYDRADWYYKLVGPLFGGDEQLATHSRTIFPLGIDAAVRFFMRRY